jgi:hypothetical protein
VAVAFVNVGAITDNNLTFPFGAGSTNDLLVFMWESDTGTDQAVASGWTAPAGSKGTTTGGHAIGYLWKLAANGSSGSQAFTGLVGSFWTGQMWRYSGVDTTTPINVGAVEVNSITTAAITTTVDNCMEVVAVSYDAGSSSASAPSGFTRRVDGTGTENWYGAERVKTTAGATATATFQSASGFGVGMVHIALAPAAGAAAVYRAPTIVVPTVAVQRASRW